MLSLVHPVRREDIFSYSNDVDSTFYLNTFFAGQGVMVYGEGLPPGLGPRPGSGSSTWRAPWTWSRTS